MSIWTRAFGWWDSQTLNTRFYTWRYGEKVGQDDLGNTYYQTAGGKRRWVIYEGEAEASKVPADWHGWLHHTFALPPTRDPLPRRDWQKPALSNLTGTPGAYHPPGSIVNAVPLPRTDYDAWSPE